MNPFVQVMFLYVPANLHPAHQFFKTFVTDLTDVFRVPTDTYTRGTESE